MTRTLLLSALIATVVIPALAQTIPPQLQGRTEWASKAPPMSMTVIDVGNGQAAVDLRTGRAARSQCGGQISGRANYSAAGRILLMTQRPEEGGSCEIRILFSSNYKEATIDEDGDGCSYYHGASCDFDGSVIRAR